MKRIVVLVSGGGTNLQALLDVDKLTAILTAREHFGQAKPVVFRSQPHEKSGIGCTGAHHGLPAGAQLAGQG